MQERSLFGDGEGARRLPIAGEQKDIRYLALSAQRVLNGPETTGMGFWSINPYTGCAFGCAYCYARYAHRYVMERAASADRLEAEERDGVAAMPPWLAFERRILVKQNAAAALRRQLRRGGDRSSRLQPGETIVIGTATDPYQPAERRFRITRGILEVLAEHASLSIVIITKSPLVTRDVDLLAALGQRSTLSVHVSLITIDRELARRIEPRAPTPEARLRAIARLREAGIDVSVNVMPVLPGITDEPAAIDALVQRVAAAGATRVSACALRLQSEARKRYLPFIEQEFPHLTERYHATYGSTYHAGDRYREGLSAFFARICRRHGIRFGHRDEDAGPGDTTPEAPTAVAAPPRLPEQLLLF